MTDETAAETGAQSRAESAPLIEAQHRLDLVIHALDQTVDDDLYRRANEGEAVAATLIGFRIGLGSARAILDDLEAEQRHDDGTGSSWTAAP